MDSDWSAMVGLMLIIHDALGCWCWIYVQQQAMVISLHLPSLGSLYSLAHISLLGCTLRLRSWAQSLTSPKTQKKMAWDGPSTFQHTILENLKHVVV